MKIGNAGCRNIPKPRLSLGFPGRTAGGATIRERACKRESATSTRVSRSSIPFRAIDSRPRNNSTTTFTGSFWKRRKRRSEERRVGKECRAGRATYRWRKKQENDSDDE